MIGRMIKAILERFERLRIQIRERFLSRWCLVIEKEREPHGERDD